jgi:hypothetical protein
MFGAVHPALLKLLDGRAVRRQGTALTPRDVLGNRLGGAATGGAIAVHDGFTFRRAVTVIVAAKHVLRVLLRGLI